jgi:hypothetical protein
MVHVSANVKAVSLNLHRYITVAHGEGYGLRLAATAELNPAFARRAALDCCCAVPTCCAGGEGLPLASPSPVSFVNQ